MPYKLLLSEEISPAVRRMMLEQLKTARRSLASHDNVQDGVHKTRKSLKKIRSLLRLARPLLKEKFYKSENKLYRSISRQLDAPRSFGAHLETLQKFERHSNHAQFGGFLADVKDIILKEKHSQEAELEIVALSGILEKMDGAIDCWETIQLDAADFDVLAHGFATTYGRGREKLKIAIEKNDSFHLHEWRKDLQQNWRHMQILTLIWPEDIMPRIKLAREISQLLGTEHDIAELLALIKMNKSKLLANHNNKPLMKAFRRHAKTAKRDLCFHALERGRRLYAIKTEALENAMVTYWRTAKALQPMPSIALEMTNLTADNNRRLQQKRTARLHTLKSGIRSTSHGSSTGGSETEQPDPEAGYKD